MGSNIVGAKCRFEKVTRKEALIQNWRVGKIAFYISASRVCRPEGLSRKVSGDELPGALYRSLGGTLFKGAVLRNL